VTETTEQKRGDDPDGLTSGNMDGRVDIRVALFASEGMETLEPHY